MARFHLFISFLNSFQGISQRICKFSQKKILMSTSRLWLFVLEKNERFSDSLIQDLRNDGIKIRLQGSTIQGYSSRDQQMRQKRQCSERHRKSRNLYSYKPTSVTISRERYKKKQEIR
uniref:Uncharacterized protein n=1 Tax=Ascaris lumbricoides TaxID=6252 RepID=A0A0M3I1X1_ASCLU